MGLHLGAVRAQVGVGVLKPGDGTMTQAPCDCHQRVEILQLVELLGRKDDAEMVGITWSTGKLGVQMTASQLRISQLSWGLRHVWVWARVDIIQVRCVRQGWATSRYVGITQRSGR